MNKLENNRVILKLLSIDNVLDLNEIATEPNLIQYSPSDISSTSALKSYIKDALKLHKDGTAIPFSIYDKKFQEYAGSTRFGFIDHQNKVLHIGWTWIGQKFQSTGLNQNIKFLMLEYAFEDMQFKKVEFRIDERNIKSRKAVEAIGASLEGILRSNVIMMDGFRRNTCCYGILLEEWPNIKSKLQKQI